MAYYISEISASKRFRCMKIWNYHFIWQWQITRNMATLYFFLCFHISFSSLLIVHKTVMYVCSLIIHFFAYLVYSQAEIESTKWPWVSFFKAERQHLSVNYKMEQRSESIKMMVKHPYLLLANIMSNLVSFFGSNLVFQQEGNLILFSVHFS